MPKKTKKQKLLADRHRRNPTSVVTMQSVSPADHQQLTTSAAAYSLSAISTGNVLKTASSLRTAQDIAILKKDLLKTIIFVSLIFAIELLAAKYI